ncbi:MAG: AI-2E family transporter [Hyphomonadaceae bacterium]|nr:AI-2E family transporter [Hyphomonadaceae bacterium]
MDLSQRAPLWIVAAGVIAAGLFFLREPLTQFALALILWLAIDGLAETLDKRLPVLPRWLALPIALVLVLSLVALVVFVIVSNLGAMAANYASYETRLNALFAQGYAMLGLAGPAPTLENLIARLDPGQVATEVGQGLRALSSDIMFILIYLGFMFPAAAVMPRKLNFIFGRGAKRESARDVFHRIRVSMETYLWVQTVISLIITALTYVTLVIIGVNNALFWSFVIFFLNYIPTIGSVVATVVATAAAIVQFDSIGPIIATGVGVGAWQFIIGNFVQPRMTGDSLNLSAVVVLLALAIWGAIWGIAGAFLAAPLTVMLMIVLAQFQSTRWIAILLSADGKPTAHVSASA